MKLPSFLSRRAALLAFTVAACSSDPMGPASLDRDLSMSKMSVAAPAFDRDDDEDDDEREVVSVLERKDELEENITVSAVISNRGGSIEIKDAGVTLIVPPNALNGATSMRFSVTALSGRSIAYEFAPHGTTFSAPLVVIQDVKKTNWKKVKDLFAVEGAYFTDTTRLSPDGTLAAVSEFRPALVELGKNKISFTVDHFSGYLVSSGRRATR